jgi:tetratricopeptide (TPR) repeat protein
MKGVLVMTQQIGSKIMKIRNKQGLTQAQLAKDICDRSHISMIETGRSTPSFTLLEKLAARLRVSLPDLLGDTVPPSREASFSFDLLIEHIESLLASHMYRDGCILVRKQLRHPEVAASLDKLAQLYRYAGICEAMLGSFDRAAANLNKAKQYAEQSRDLILLLDALVSLGALHNKLSQFGMAEALYSEALSRIPKEPPLITQAKIHFGLGVALQGQQQFRPALKVLKTGLDLLLKNNSMYLIGEFSACIGTCYEALNRWEEAILYHQKSAAYHTLADNRQFAAAAYSRIATCYQYANNAEDSQAHHVTSHHTKSEHTAYFSTLIPAYHNSISF